MKGTFKRSFFFFIIILNLAVVALYSQINTNTDFQPQVSGQLPELLSGKSANVDEIILSLPETDLPAALGVAEQLSFKALHNDIPMSPEAVVRVRQTIESRLQKAKSVSLQSSEQCPVSVPARRLNVAGTEITVPSYFVTDQPIIISQTPTGEAGTFFPTISVTVAAAPGAKLHSAFLLNGKPFPLKQESSTSLIYRPRISAENSLSIGTHTAQITVTDARGRTASATWFFTVGIEQTETIPIPDGSMIVGSFTMDVSKIFTDIKSDCTVLVTIYETTDGKRIVEYALYDPQKPGHPMVKTQSLVWLRHFARRNHRNDPAVLISPKSPYVFTGNQLTISAKYLGPGTVTKTDWRILSWVGTAGQYSYFVGPEFPWVMQDSLNVMCWLVVEERLAAGKFSQVTVSGEKSFGAVNAYTEIPLFRNLSLTRTGTGSMSLKGERTCPIKPWPEDIIEGEKIPLLTTDPETESGQGECTVVRSRWAVIAGEEIARVENPLATQTKLLFSKPGHVEVIHDVALRIDWGDERYESDFKPQQSGLFGLFKNDSDLTFKAFPPGVLLGTSRNFAVEKFVFKIQDQTRIVTSPSQLVLGSPMVFAHSTLFPASAPLEITKFFVAVLTRNYPPGFLDEAGGFQWSLNYNFTPSPHNGEVLVKPIFFPWLFKNGDRPFKADYPDIYPSFTDWLPVKTYDTPANLVNVEITPSEPPPVPEGQTLNFEAALVPKPGLGSGKIDSSGGTMNLLEGYEVTGYEAPSWQAVLASDEKQLHTPSWEFQFTPTNGTGTFFVKAASNLKVKEQNTGDVADVTASGQVAVKVVPGLKIKSPRPGMTYPKDWIIKVETSIDNDTEKWKTLKWFVGETQVKPNTDTPPWNLELPKVGSYTLKVIQPDPNNSQIVLASDSVVFQIKPVTVSLTPARKVVAFAPRQAVPLQAMVELNGNQLPKPGESVEWGSSKWKATVKNVEWKALTKAEGCATLEVSPDNALEATTRFSSAGAATVLATITIQVEPAKKSKEDIADVFVLPAVRADVWAVPQPKWAPLNTNFPANQLPVKAIAPAGRTFSMKDGVVSLASGEYTWSAESGLVKEIVIPPALPDSIIAPIKCNQVKIKWNGPDEQASTDFTFVPTFKKPGSTSIKLLSYLAFENNVEICFPETSIPVVVSDIESLIEYYVNPKSFQMVVGETKIFKFILRLKNTPPAPNMPASKEVELSLLDGIYKLTLDEVAWHSERNTNGGSSIARNLDYSFTPAIDGQYKIVGQANCKVMESIVSEKCEQTTWLWSGQALATGTVSPVAFSMKSIEFTSDHNVLKKNPPSGSIWGDSESAYETPEWLADVRSNPISHTKNSKLTATVKFMVQPAGVLFDLIGDGPDDFVDFEEANQTSTGEVQEVAVIAKASLPDQVGILDKTIKWKIRVNTVSFDAPSPSVHKIYVTYNTPAGSAVTECRIQEVCSLASGKSSLVDCADSIFAGLRGSFALSAPMWGPSPIWLLHDLELGLKSQCPGLADYVNKHFQLLGLGFGTIRYCHATPDGRYEDSTDPGFVWREVNVEHPAETTHDDIDRVEKLMHFDYSNPPGANSYEATCYFNGKHYALGVGVYSTAKEIVKNAFSPNINWIFCVFFDPSSPDDNSKWNTCAEAPWLEMQ